jgi:hypothetical protein
MIHDDDLKIIDVKFKVNNVIDFQKSRCTVLFFFKILSCSHNFDIFRPQRIKNDRVCIVMLKSIRPLKEFFFNN